MTNSTTSQRPDLDSSTVIQRIVTEHARLPEPDSLARPTAERQITDNLRDEGRNDADIDQLCAAADETEAQAAARMEKAAEAAEKTTDQGNAKRLIKLYGARIRYVYETKTWLVWDGSRWALDKTGVIEQYAQATARAIYGEANRSQDGDERQRLAKWAAASENATRVDAMLKTTRSHAKVAITPEVLDSNTLALNVGNGIVDLTCGELRPHDSRGLHSKIAGAQLTGQPHQPGVTSWRGYYPTTRSGATCRSSRATRSQAR
jgi:phage/plasmid-associated DNA primase